MKQENKNSKAESAANSEKNIPSQKITEKENNVFPGYPLYPKSDDIFNKETEVDLNTEDLSEIRSHGEKQGKRNEKDISSSRRVGSPNLWKTKLPTRKLAFRK